MAMNVKCPNCGSTRVQLSNERSKHGLLWFVLFGVFYIMWIIFKWFIGLCVLIFFDSWMFFLKKAQGKGYVFKSKGWFSGNKRIYYCHDCGTNFKA